jgi:uncharacterized protein (DUF58 family)
MTGEDVGDDLLPPALLAQLERLQLRTRRRLAGRFAGEHRSPHFGSSVDFADYREYHAGDDYRRIDYPLFARTGHLFIRLFEAEDDISLRIVLDRSASMGFHGKLDQARRLAAAIGFVALLRRDTVTLHTEPAARAARRYAGRHAAQVLFRDLAALDAAGPTDLARAAGDVLARPGPVGVTVVISDLLNEGWDRAIDRLVARGGDTTVLHVLAEEELRPDARGDLQMVDAETGEEVPVSLSPDSLADFGRAVDHWLAETAAHCRGRGATYERVMAATPVADVLLRTWRETGLVR